MKFSFEVGAQEKHHVDFVHTWITGYIRIIVDGKIVKRDLRTISVTLIKKYEFDVGLQEQHKVTIEKERKLLFPAFRPQKYRAFVDGKLLHEYEGF